jgi:hypothetical protein
MYKRIYTVYISLYGRGHTSTVLIKIHRVTFNSIFISLFPSLRFEFFSGLTQKGQMALIIQAVSMFLTGHIFTYMLI